MVYRLPRRYFFAFSLAGLGALLMYGLTAFPTITWWDASEYITAAYTLGVPHPPGSLLLVVSGWVFTKLIPWIAPAFLLNLLAGVFAGGTVLMVGYLGFKLSLPDVSLPIHQYGLTQRFMSIGIISSGLWIFAFSNTLWFYATQFTPYILTGLFTAFILWVLLRWWEADESDHATGWFFFIALFFGLDFSVHRTNWLLLPGLLSWVLLMRPKTLFSPKVWGAGLGGLLAGLSVQFLIIPLATRNPLLNFTDPSTWKGFWDYIALKQVGGGMLINLFPRQGSFWSYQVMDYLRAFSRNFFSWQHPLGIFGLLPGLVGMAGLVVLWTRRWRLACALSILFLLSSLGAVIYFNLPAEYFRSIDRHYLPSFVIFGIWIIYGVHLLIEQLDQLSRKYRIYGTGMVLLLLLLTVTDQILTNYRHTNGSHRYFAYDYAHNLLASLPKNAIFFVAGDAHTFPVWYLQYVEGFRTDVTVCNLNLMNTTWYLRQILSRDLDFPLSITNKQAQDLRVISWRDSTIVLPTPPDTGQDATQPVRVNVPPTLGDSHLYVHDQLLLKIFRDNAWHRPIYFTWPEFAATWVIPYLRQEGVVYRFTPMESPPLDTGILRTNVLSRYLYRGYADPTTVIDGPTTVPLRRYYNAFLQLAGAERRAGHQEDSNRIMQRMIELLPPTHLHPPENIREAIQNWKTSRKGQ